jgi:hypothetical protein
LRELWEQDMTSTVRSFDTRRLTDEEFEELLVALLVDDVPLDAYTLHTEEDDQ